MRSGRLRTQGVIEQRPTSQVAGGPGDQSANWTPFATVYADIEPKSGRELTAAGAGQNVGTHVITIRYIDGVTAQMRFNDNGTYYNFTAPPRNKDFRNVELQIDAEVGLVDG